MDLYNHPDFVTSIQRKSKHMESCRGSQMPKISYVCWYVKKSVLFCQTKIDTIDRRSENQWGVTLKCPDLQTGQILDELLS